MTQPETAFGNSSTGSLVENSIPTTPELLRLYWDRRNLQNQEDTKTLNTALEGVAATLIFRAPKWFHLRYKVMLDNVLANLPDHRTWKVQVVLNTDWAIKELWPWHPGLVRLLTQDPRVIVSPLPKNMTHFKPKDIVASTWFWNAMAGEKVLLFSGNGAVCGNHPTEIWRRLSDVDFCGVPSSSPGGDASSHSWRTKRAMQALLNAGVDATSSKAMAKYLISQKNPANTTKPLFQVAGPELTHLFGGVYNLSSSANGVAHIPLVVAGTQSRLTYAERDSLLKHCPELKVIFPSMHEPACFGAHPEPETCRASICALRDGGVPSHGC